MDRIDCPYCDRIGSLYAERVIRGHDVLTVYFCDACHSEWDEREGEPPPERPRTRLPMTSRDKTGRS
jgi:hypothetical protein